MALASQLIPGYKYRVWTGRDEDEVVTIVDNTILPKHHQHQRKITVRLSDGSIDYMLPRVLEDKPVGVDLTALPNADVIAEAVAEEGEKDTLVIEPEVEEPVAVTIAAPTELLSAPDKKARTIEPITDPMDPRLDSFRPSRTKLRKYVNRVMENGMLDIDFLLTFTSDAYRADNEGRPVNIALAGDTQSGKTLVVEVLAIVWAERLGLPKPLPVFTLSGSMGVTDFELFGQLTSYMDIDLGDDYLVWLRGVVDLAARVGGLLYIDEINALSERVTTALFSILDHRHLFTNSRKAQEKDGEFLPEVVVGHQDLWIIATYNPGGYRGMSDMNEALLNRFRHIPWGYDQKVEEKLIKSPAVRLLGDKLRTARKANKLRTPIGTSALQNLERDFHTFGPEVATQIISGMFKHNEVPVVDEILHAGGVLLALQEEQKQALLDAADGNF